MYLSNLKRVAKIKWSLAWMPLLPAVAFGFVENPDLTGAGVIAALRADATYSSRPYQETFNLGATGLRGWIYMDTPNKRAGTHGFLTATSRQILVTATAAPGNAVLKVDDVILGATAVSTGAVPLFTTDSRKAFGTAIGAAEVAAANGQPNNLRVKRWRAGVTTDVSIPMATMQAYSPTAPYTCPKSTAILAAARTKLVSQLLADPSFLGHNYGGGIKALALLAGVTPQDANYAAVQARLKSYAISLAAKNLSAYGSEWWDWAYMNTFLSEYYLRCIEDSITPDPSILPGISRYTVAISKGQSRYGTFNHGGTAFKADGTLHGTTPPYGPVNAAGIPANISIVMGKKALLKGGVALDPEINPAIQHASDFFGYYKNKGSIPYGEHEPWMAGHSSNGKDPMCAVFFGLQADRPTETEYFTRMAVAQFTGREYGHTGQGWSYLWGALGANAGGPLALAKYMENCRWHSDLARRTDGAFSYDGQEQFGGGWTEDGSYLGVSRYNGINATSSYVLTYSLPLQRLYITGRNANPANTLTAAKVTNAVAAATYREDCSAYTNARLTTDLSEFDPIVRQEAAKRLASRNLTSSELNILIGMVTNMSDANGRMGACETLGYLNNPTALPLIKDRLTDPDLWVRAKAANAIRTYSPNDAGVHRDSMLTAFIANSTDPDAIVWNDPLQMSNRYLSLALFGNGVGDGTPGNTINSFTKNAEKPLLYQALKVAMKQPDSYPRVGVAEFIRNHLNQTDVYALTTDIFTMIRSKSQADPMWYYVSQLIGLEILNKYKCAEVIPLALTLVEVQYGWTWDSTTFMPPGMATIVAQGDLARWALPTLKKDLVDFATMHPSDYGKLKGPMQDTINSVTNAIAPATGLVYFLPMATSQVVTTTTAKAITLAGTTPRGALTYTVVTQPTHGTLSGTAPNLIYTPTAGYRGVDKFTFKVTDNHTTSEPGTVSIIAGLSGNGLQGRYFDNMDSTNLKLTRVDPQVNFDWGNNSPNASMGADTFSVRWSGQLLVPETGKYTFSTLNSDGVKLTVNGVRVIDDFVDQNTCWNDGTSINLTAGQKVDLVMDYYDNTGSAVAKLKWTGPSFAGVNGTLISKDWLFDGSDIPNSIPLAEAQILNVFKNGSQPITLTGRSSSPAPLAYEIVTQPSNGTLTGTAPNLTYRPATNFSGTDRFTFKVDNGSNSSAAATITLNVSTVQLTNYFWSQPVAGNWNGPFWKDAAGANVTLASGGGASYSLNFDKPGTYITTQNLNSNFVFNQLNIASEVTVEGSSSLAPTAVGPFLPQVNHNGSGSFTLNTPVNLAAMTTLGGTGQGFASFSAPITGSGGLTLNSDATWTLFGLPTNAPNTYQGGTIIRRGVLQLGTVPGEDSPLCADPAGSGPITLNEGASILFQRVTLTNAMTLNGGTLFTPNGWGAVLSGPINLNGTVMSNNSLGTLTYSGILTGRGGFTKSGAAKLRFSGTNNSTGRNSITQGILQCRSNTALGRGFLNISDGATVELAYSGTRVITGLSYNGGNALPPGIYGSATSSAANVSPYFTGTGTITIPPSSSTTLARTAGSNPSMAGSPVTFTATVVGAAPTGMVHFMNGTTLLGMANLNNMARATLTLSGLMVGGHGVTAEYVGDNNNSASYSPAVNHTVLISPFQTWASSNGQGLTLGVNSGADQDPDNDGLCNLVEFALGTAPMGMAPTAAPTLTKTASTLVFTYNRSDASLAPGMIQAVEYGNNLSGWVSIPITPESGGAVTVTPGVPSDRISVSIPNAGPKTFVRLKVAQ